MRDGVCDELTNTERCLYDGGDCCLGMAKKDSSMCKICTCRVSVDLDSLNRAFTESKVMKFFDPGDFQQAILRTEKTVDEVLSEEECAMMCLDSSLEQVVNAWRYNVEASICTCSWLKSTECLDLVLARPFNEDNLYDYDQELVSSYVETTKMLDCSI